jgi:hypothetical protein
MDNVNEQMLIRAILDLTKEIKELRQELKPQPDIRVVTQKTVKEPKTEFEDTLAFTTRQVNEHLNGLMQEDAIKIVKEALGVTTPDHGKGSPFTEYLNNNYGTIAPQAQIDTAIDEAVQYAKNKPQKWGGNWGDRIREDRSVGYVDEQLKGVEKK